MKTLSSEDYHASPLYRIRHSAAHIMAAAVLEMFPEGKVAIGPPIEHGFYYDFDLPRQLTQEDLEKIEGRMRELIASRLDFQYQEITPEEGQALFADQPYKLELIHDILERRREVRRSVEALHLPQRRLRRPMPRSARPQLEGNRRQGREAAQYGWRLLARRLQQADAPAYLRHGVAQAQ